MVQKRPFDDDEIFEASSKLPRQMEQSNQLVSFSESVFREEALQIPNTLEGGLQKGNTEVDEKLFGEIFSELPSSAEDIEASVPGSVSISSLATSSTSEEDYQLEAPVHVSFFPEYFYTERPTRTLAHYEDIYSILLNHPPRKRVPIGCNHQAEIPAWGSRGTEDTSHHFDSAEAISNSDLIVGNEDEKRLMETCVLPMPNLELSTCNCVKVGNGRNDCGCEDVGSVRCVRQHIGEARDKLMKSLGLEKFMELGFCDMGEQVAEKWDEEEQQLFNEIVFSNPSLLGKNFWEILPIAFPTRTKKEFVNYYFNVFVLRRRAEQNRCDPMNIDSDNDEWQGGDDYGENEHGMSEEDEDSVIESPLYHDNPGYDQSSREDDLQEYDENAADGICDNNLDVAGGGDVTNPSETSTKKLPDKCGPSPTILLEDKIPWDDRGDEEVQDDSCTSSDTGVDSQGSKAKSEDGNHWPSSIVGLHSGVGLEYIVEPCDSKVWDGGFMTCPKNKVDLLPTCSMIEEIFGDES